MWRWLAGQVVADACRRPQPCPGPKACYVPVSGDTPEDNHDLRPVPSPTGSFPCAACPLYCGMQLTAERSVACRWWTIAAVTALVGVSVLGGATPAAARELGGVDVTSSTTANFWVAPVWKQYDAGIVRYEDYQSSPAGRFVYSAAIGELWDSGKRCVLTRNGKVLIDGKCRDEASWGDGLELGGSGRYVLTANGRRMASWAFKRPTAVPRPLTSAVCVLNSVTPGKVTPSGPVFILSTNDQCTNGYWYYEAVYPGGGSMYARFDFPANGRVLAMGLTDRPIRAPCRLCSSLKVTSSVRSFRLPPTVGPTSPGNPCRQPRATRTRLPPAQLNSSTPHSRWSRFW